MYNCYFEKYDCHCYRKKNNLRAGGSRNFISSKFRHDVTIDIKKRIP